MRISIIAAMSSNRVIGRDNTLPWRLAPDLRRFKRLTMGATLIMGRRTFESIGRPLPGRNLVVITTRAGFAPPGVRVAGSIDAALDIARTESAGAEAFIAGGAEVYRLALDRADRLYLTLLERDYDGDVHFPAIDISRWRLTSEEGHPAQSGDPAYRFLVYDRIDGGDDGEREGGCA